MMLLQLSTGLRGCRGGLAKRALECPGFAGEVAFEAADDLGFGLAFGDPAAT